MRDKWGPSSIFRVLGGASLSTARCSGSLPSEDLGKDTSGMDEMLKLDRWGETVKPSPR